MLNLSQDELELIAKMNNLQRQKLEQIAKNRSFKKCKNMSKEVLLISFLKSEQSINELRKSNNYNVEIKEIKEKFNLLRNKFSREKIEEIRKNFYKKEKIDNCLKELEQKDSLTEQEEKEKDTILKN